MTISSWNHETKLGEYSIMGDKNQQDYTRSDGIMEQWSDRAMFGWDSGMLGSVAEKQTDTWRLQHFVALA
jgi:hypothetical protein